MINKIKISSVKQQITQKKKETRVITLMFTGQAFEETIDWFKTTYTVLLDGCPRGVNYQINMNSDKKL